MITTKHKLSYCNLCQTEMIKCATCGNNCCNGGSGEVNGETCKDCDDAYNIQNAYLNDPDSVLFLKE